MKTFLIPLLVMTLGACARPKYYSRDFAPDSSMTRKASAGADCRARFQKTNLCVDVIWDTAPSESTMGSFVFKTFRANRGDGSALTVDPPNGTTCIVELWMPSMGHGSSPVTISPLDIGTFRASRVFFIMKGNWEIRFELKQGGEVIDQAVLPVAI